MDSTGLDVIAKASLCSFATSLVPYTALNSQLRCGTPNDHQGDRSAALLSVSVLSPSSAALFSGVWMERDETREAGIWEEESQPLLWGPGPGGFILKAIDIKTLGT